MKHLILSFIFLFSSFSYSTTLEEIKDELKLQEKHLTDIRSLKKIGYFRTAKKRWEDWMKTFDMKSDNNKTTYLTMILGQLMECSHYNAGFLDGSEHQANLLKRNYIFNKKLYEKINKKIKILRKKSQNFVHMEDFSNAIYYDTEAFELACKYSDYLQSKMYDYKEEKTKGRLEKLKKEYNQLKRQNKQIAKTNKNTIK